MVFFCRSFRFCRHFRFFRNFRFRRSLCFRRRFGLCRERNFDHRLFRFFRSFIRRSFRFRNFRNFFALFLCRCFFRFRDLYGDAAAFRRFESDELFLVFLLFFNRCLGRSLRRSFFCFRNCLFCDRCRSFLLFRFRSSFFSSGRCFFRCRRFGNGRSFFLYRFCCRSFFPGRYRNRFFDCCRRMFLDSDLCRYLFRSCRSFADLLDSFPFSGSLISDDPGKGQFSDGHRHDQQSDQDLFQFFHVLTSYASLSSCKGDRHRMRHKVDTICLLYTFTTKTSLYA